MEEFKDPRRNKIVITIAIVCALFVVLFIAYLTLSYTSDKAELEKEKDKEQVVKMEYDPSIPITRTDLMTVMGTAVEDIYGVDYSTLVEDEVINIPDTEIYYESVYVNNPIDVMALHALAVKRNPYAFVNEGEDTVRQLPDGTEIDLADYLQEYSSFSIGESEETPAYIDIEGYENGNWFNEQIDLTEWYASYY